MKRRVQAAIIQVRILLDDAIYRCTIRAEYGAWLGPGFAVLAEAIGGVAACAFVETFRPDIEEGNESRGDDIPKPALTAASKPMSEPGGTTAVAGSACPMLMSAEITAAFGVIRAVEDCL